MANSTGNTRLRNDEQYIAHLVRNSKSRRGKVISGDKYFNPQTIGSGWLNPSDRLFSIDGAQIASSSVTWSNIFDKASTWVIEFTIGSYVAGNITVGNSEDVSGNLSGDGDYSIELNNYEDFDLLLTADSNFNGTVTISAIKRLS